MDGHVIVCGLQGVGLRAVEQFHLSGTQVVVIDDDADPRFSRTLGDWGVPHVRRHAHRGEGFEEAGLARAASVVCVEVDEIHTLETALRIKEIRPDLPLVVQLANPSVAQALERVSGPGSVLDVASLAAPSFVEACLGRPSHAIELAGVDFAVVQLGVEASEHAHDTFRGHFGHLAPVAIMPSGDAPMATCPGRDHPLHPGDRVAVLGTLEDFRQTGISTTRPTDGPTRSVGLARRIRLQIGIALEEGNRALAVVASALLALIVAATIVLHFAYRPGGTQAHLGFLSSLYFTVETVATVGYGDYTFARQSPWLLVAGIVLIISGVALVSTAFALFTNILVSRRIERSLGRRQVPGMVDHVIVIGLGAVGISVVRGLVAEGESVVVIERDADNRYLAQARALGVPVVIADATQSQTHRMVNIADAKAVAVLTSADLTNIETGLSVRESLGERWDDVPVVLARLRPRAGTDDGAELRLPARPLHLGPRRTVVRRRRPRARCPQHVLRRPTAVPGGRPLGGTRRRPAGAGHAGSLVTDPGHRTEPGRRRRAGAPAPPGHRLRRRGHRVPPRPLRGAPPGPAARSDTRLASRHHGAP